VWDGWDAARSVGGVRGTVGSFLTRLLADRGASVRAMARHLDRGALPAGVEPFAGNLDDPSAVQTALDGVSRVFLLTGGPQGPQRDQTLAQAAAQAGVEHLVKLSVLGITEGADDLITRWHRAGEQAITDPGPAGHAYPLTGPEAITPRQQAAVLADLIGHPIDFVDITPDQARDQMV